MREPDARGIWFWTLGRLGWIALAASGLTAAAGCGGDDGRPWEAKRASEVRELDFLQDVEVIEMTRAEFSAQAADRADDIDDALLQNLADTYGRLGFFRLDADLRAILAGSSSDYVGATYSPRTKVITLVRDKPDDAPSSTQVHEYVHALQDQHFDLTAYDRSTSDEFLARRAVVEGDAVLAQLRFTAQDEHDGEVDGWDWPGTLANWQVWADDLLATAPYPVFFVDYPSFVYAFGIGFTATNLLGPSFTARPPHDWGLEDELFTDRPPATAQEVILRDIDVDPVERVGLDAVPSALAGRLEFDSWDTLGEWYVYLLFYPLTFGARDIASRWDGDRVLFVRDPMREGAMATVWASAWDDDVAADLVARTLYQLYGRLPDDAVPEAGTSADGEALWIERRDNRVVAIKNLDPELAPTVADAAFSPPVEHRAQRSRTPLAWRVRDLLR